MSGPAMNFVWMLVTTSPDGAEGVMLEQNEQGAMVPMIAWTMQDLPRLRSVAKKRAAQPDAWPIKLVRFYGREELESF